MKFCVKLITVLVTIAVLLFLGGCEKQDALSSLDSGEINIVSSPTNFLKPGDPLPGDYPQSGSCIAEFWAQKNGYKGNSINVPNGSNFSFQHESLTPPPGIPFGDPVPIMMLVEKDTINNELLFTFGESGCQFNPAAEVVFDYTDLGISAAQLYYIDDNGNYVPQSPASVNTKNKRMLIYVDHFSRYAIGAE
jgi:hypothetical protein